MKPRIIIIGGFALGTLPLKPLAQKLADFDVIFFDPLLDQGIDSFLEFMAKHLKEKNILLGWSLGGQLATLLAHRYPNKIVGLFTLQSNPCFQKSNNWPCGMAVQVFKEFTDLFLHQAEFALQRFMYLLSLGEPQQKKIFTALKHYIPVINTKAYFSGLTALAELDTRILLEEIQTVNILQFHLFAQNDALIDASIIDFMPAQSKFFHCAILANSGHIAPYSQLDKVYEILSIELQKLGQ